MMKKDIEDKVKDIIDLDFEVEECCIIPDMDDSRLTFSNKGLRSEATTLYIDMRESTKILNKHNRKTIAKTTYGIFSHHCENRKIHGW